MPHPADASPPRRLDPRRAAGIREDRTNPRRIDIMMKNKRMFQLAVPSAEERPPWCDALKKAFVDALAADTAGISLDPPQIADVPPAEGVSGGGAEELEQSMRDEGEEQPELDGADKPPALHESTSSLTESSRGRGISLAI